MDKLSSAVLFESRQAFPLARSQFALPGIVCSCWPFGQKSFVFTKSFQVMADRTTVM